jgi:hypothetical protein
LKNFEEDDLLDTPIRNRPKVPMWATVGAVGILGVAISTTVKLQHQGLFSPTISVSDIMATPVWVYTVHKVSALILLIGVTLTVGRKEPKSTFRTLVITLGTLLLIMMLLSLGFVFYMNNFHVREF